MKNKQWFLNNVLLVFLGLLMVLLLSAQWFHLNKNIRAYKTQQDEELRHIQKLKGGVLMNLSQIKEGDSVVEIEITDIEEINNKFDYLVDYVDSNTNRAESIIDKDLDRLNLIITVGIGLLGLLGVFVPLAVNVISAQDLRSTIDDIQLKIEDHKKFQKEFSEGMLKLTEDYNKAVPEITTLILQNAIGRFFNISPLIITRLSRNEDRDYFIELLDSIKLAFLHCDGDTNHVISKNGFLKSTIKDFRRFILNEKFNSVNFSITIVEKFRELSQLLGVLSEANEVEQGEAHIQVRHKIDEIIEELKS